VLLCGFLSSHYDDFDSLEGPKEVNADALVLGQAHLTNNYFRN
jgi:hypothetical protein